MPKRLFTENKPPAEALIEVLKITLERIKYLQKRKQEGVLINTYQTKSLGFSATELAELNLIDV